MTRPRVILHFEEGMWWAESPDVACVTVTAATLPELRAAVREAMAFHLDLDAVTEIAESFAHATSADKVAWTSHSGAAVTATQRVLPARVEASPRVVL